MKRRRRGRRLKGDRCRGDEDEKPHCYVSVPLRLVSRRTAVCQMSELSETESKRWVLLDGVSQRLRPASLCKHWEAVPCPTGSFGP